MLGKLFRPRWQHPKPETRLEAIASLRDNKAAHQDILETIARQDDNHNVRIAAIAKIESADKLFALLEDTSGNISQAVINRLQLLLQSSPDLSKKLLDNISAYRKPLQVSVLLSCLPEAADQEKILANCNEEDLLLEIAEKAGVAKTRKLAAEKIQNPDLLEQLARSSKGHDKTIHRIARTRLAEIRDRLKQDDSLTTVLEGLCQKLEALARAPYTPLLQSQLSHLEQQWHESKGQHSELHERFESAAKTCGEKISQHNETEDSDASTQDEQQTDAANETQQREQQQALCNAIEALHQSVVSCRDYREQAQLIEEQLDKLLKQQQALASSGTAHPVLNLRFSTTSKNLAELENAIKKLQTAETTFKAVPFETAEDLDRKSLEKLLRALESLSWPEGFSKPEAFDQLQQQKQPITAAIATFDARQQQLRDNIEKSLLAIEKALADGAVNEAGNTLRDTYDRINQLQANERRGFEPRLQHLGKQLAELREWQGFAATPKKEALCEAMEKLLATELPPVNKAAAIRDLRKQWKALKGTHSDAENALWQRFNTAADQAWEPCKAWFEAQDKIKASNLEKRVYICEQLETFDREYHWDTPDWKAVAKILETAHREFRQFSPVDQRQHKVIKLRFDKAMDPLHQKLKQERDKNTEFKKQLVDKMQALAGQDDLDAGIEAAKALQREWRECGITHRKTDQQLWEQFRQSADALFARRENAHQEKLEQAQHELQLAEQLIEQIQQLADSGIDTLKQSRGQYEALVSRFSELQSLDKKAHAGLFRDFSQARQYYDNSLASIEDKQFDANLAIMAQKAAVCEKLESSVNNCPDTLLENTAHQWQQFPELPSAMASAIEARYQRALQCIAARKSPDYIANKKRLQSILVQLEILMDRETPEQDKKLRMDIQMQSLASQFGKNPQDTPAKIRELCIEWYACPMCGSMVQIQLNERFASLLNSAANS